MIWRKATAADIPAIIALLSDDVLGQSRESADAAPYLVAFDAMAAEPTNHQIVGEDDGRVVACYQITFISGLSQQGARRALVEAVRVAPDLRGHGVGAALMADAEARARAEGCRMIQLTTTATRTDAQRFYARLGFTPSHIGFKKAL
ncbi:GNAT family N-acetyltransferase [Paracoccus sp. Z118]|uniref:GNAT family N-acetyltransferase n=1 Tax=Paracoccus sp. Z118 TaxID=2851017 RepID=UPI001C2C0319|nr:GNAT family N-acetyltransferase [Paracoccus sp. Z118]MBV0891776.1 GNAT family N-acetyltransferase [Paracoccus sp. Z118]